MVDLYEDTIGWTDSNEYEDYQRITTEYSSSLDDLNGVEEEDITFIEEILNESLEDYLLDNV